MTAVDSGAATPAVTGPRRTAGLLLIAGAVANCAFLVERLLEVALPLRDTFVSELGATGQPSAMFFRISDLITGLLLVAGIVISWNHLWPSRWLRVAQVSTIGFGVCTAIDAFVPLDCTPTIDAACRAREDAGDVSLAHQIHSVTGVLEGTFVNVALFAFAFGLWRMPKWGRFARVTLVLAFVYTVLNAVISWQYLGFHEGIGIVQRAQILTFAGVILAMGWKMLTQTQVPYPDVRYAAVTTPYSQFSDTFASAPGAEVRVQVHRGDRPGPRVVFSNGLGLPLDHWFGVVAALESPCILFDRPGLGGSSEWVAPPMGIRDEVALLQDVIAQHGNGPVILVGHSWGGVLAEIATRLSPDSVRALIMVDPSDPHEEMEAFDPQTHDPRGALDLGIAGRSVSGKVRAAVVGAPMNFFSHLIGTAQRDALRLSAEARAFFRDPEHLRATISELKREPMQAMEAVKIAEEIPLPAIPIHLLSGNMGGWPLRRPQTEWVNRARARCEKHGWRFSEVDGAHLLMLDQPEIVADAIREAVEASR